jgi:lipoprotein-releasing system ATP-binding protein
MPSGMNEVSMKDKGIIRLSQVYKTFKDVGTKVVVLKDLEMVVQENEFIAIRGVSGIGKSTLLHIMGLLDTPTSGQIYFGGEEVTSFSDKELSTVRNREIGFVFQFHHLLPDFTAWENVLMPLRIAGRLQSKDKEYGQELLSMVKMEHRLQHLPSELSGGERQRLALARALVHRPRILLADEPSGNLDEENKKILHKLLKDIHDKLGVTIVLVTHDTSLSDLAGKKYILHDGRITLDI